MSLPICSKFTRRGGETCGGGRGRRGKKKREEKHTSEQVLHIMENVFFINSLYCAYM